MFDFEKNKKKTLESLASWHIFLPLLSEDLLVFSFFP
jgi:hypothetical protein